MEARRCNSCSNCSEPANDDRMCGTGFLRCTKLPVWQYVSPNRTACRFYQDVAPVAVEDLAELF